MKRAISDEAWALAQLKAGRAIDHPDAIEAGHGWRLAARIYDLRKKGVQIVTRRGRNGKAAYSLPDDRQLSIFGNGPAATGPEFDDDDTHHQGERHGKS